MDANSPTPKLPMDNSQAHRQYGGAVIGLTLFTLLLTLSFTLSMHLLPQVRGTFDDRPEVVDLEGMDMDAFIEWGEELYHGRGSCPLCHNDMGRAPDIAVMDMATTSLERISASNYGGSASTIEGYLRESMVEPSAYVVPGYGKKGSGDTISQMPVIGREPIVLNNSEMDAIIAYLQDKDGAEITVSLPSQPKTPSELEVVAVEPAPMAIPTPPKTGAEVAQIYGCPACHTMLGSSSPIGPPLDQLNGRLTREQLRQGIIRPDATISPGFSAGVMPGDYATRMGVAELERLLDLLEAQ